MWLSVLKFSVYICLSFEVRKGTIPQFEVICLVYNGENRICIEVTSLKRIFVVIFIVHLVIAFYMAVPSDFYQNVHNTYVPIHI